MRETGKNGYQAEIKKKLKKIFPQCEVRKLDPNDIQGSPDLLLICPITWATLETKGFEKAKQQPNQKYYVQKHNDMSFSSFIYPEIETEVIDKLYEHINNYEKKGE